ncbi:restriction endonuclease subunit S [Paenimyroides viscosum]|uniref:Restriction endonuclease subunit S n=1 Tax=Paenimyroides viscosum TaxID=2488729 RepID=A0A3P1AYM5_9FLAO|nr:restriction endonuclease subunit S [Paenimyroides viscosum]RRA93907.1 restriction endonuclease subunit S [Paenimyroides viscosum]
MNKLDELLQGVDVEWKSLGEISEIYGGLKGKNKSDFTDGNAKYVTYKNIYNNIEVDFDTLEMVKVSQDENQYEVKYGDVLFTGSSENASEAGISSAITFKSDAKVYLNSFSFGLRFNSEIKLLPEFTKYLFRSKSIRDEIIKTASGVTRYNVSKKRFIKIQIPIPPIEIQQEIVRVLDELTTLTNQLTTELETERQNRKKQFEFFREQLFRFEEGENNYVALGELAENLDSKRKPITSSQRKPGKIPYYGASGIVDYVEDYIFDGDYLLVSEDGANLLARSTPIAFSISGKNWVNNHAHILKFETKYERLFVEYYLNSIDLAPYITGAAQPKLNKKNLNSIKIPNPALEEKERIVKLLDQFDATHTAIEEGITKEIKLRTQQYEYYREKLLSFPQN